MFYLFPDLLPELRQAIFLEALKSFPSLYSPLRKTNREAKKVVDDFLVEVARDDVQTTWGGERWRCTRVRQGTKLVFHGPMMHIYLARNDNYAGSVYPAHRKIVHYRFGVKHGPMKEWDVNTTHVVKIGQYEEGLKEGLWRVWACNGWLRSEFSYRHHKLEGPEQTWFPTGCISEKMHWLRGKRQGLYQTWWHAGHLKRSEEWVNGWRHGWKKLYDRNGEETLAVQYEYGKLVPEGMTSEMTRLNDADSDEDDPEDYSDDLEPVMLEDEWA